MKVILVPPAIKGKSDNNTSPKEHDDQELVIAFLEFGFISHRFYKYLT